MPLRLISAILLSATLVIFSATVQADQPVEENAILNAENWLSAVDREQYGASWNMAATILKKSVAREQWISSLETYRKPLGRLIERKLTDNRYMTFLPGAPDGKYVVIQFRTVFENKVDAVETVTPMLDKDGVWRVSGYYIK